MSCPFQNGEESSTSHQPEPSTSRSSNQDLAGLGLGLGLTDTLSRTSVLEEPLSSFTSDTQRDTPITPAELAANARRLAAAEAARASITDANLSAFGIQIETFSFADEESQRSPIKSISPRKQKLMPMPKHHDFFSYMANTPELFMELAKHMHIKDLLSLYAISKDFHDTINGHLSHCMRACANFMAPECAKLFFFKFYKKLCVPDPAGREHPMRIGQVRLVPGFKWLQMIVYREKIVRDILACMARQGHRMKPGMAYSLKKIWLVMDIATTAARVQMIHNERLFTDIDLYNLQFFIVKLDMRFNDPIDGPGSEDLRKLFLGQRSLTSLSLLLKRKEYLDVLSVVKLSVRYSYTVRPEHRHMPIFGIPPEEIGIGHLEGWGKGRVHLMRPDELVMRESVRRQLGLKHHIMEMMIWGYVDPIGGKDIVVSEEEKYMSDDDDEGKTVPEGWTDYWEIEENADEDSEDDEGDVDVDDNDILMTKVTLWG